MKRLVTILAVCLAAITAGAVTLETGEFTYTYPLWYPLDDCPAIFSVDIGDYNWGKE